MTMEASNILEANEEMAKKIAELIDENKTLLEKLDDQQAQLNAYEADYDELVAQSEKLKDDSDSESEAEGSEDEEAEDEEDEVEAESSVDLVEAQAKATADIILKTLGHQDPVTQPTQEASLTKENALEQYASLTDSIERSDFYAKHREIIFNN